MWDYLFIMILYFSLWAISVRVVWKREWVVGRLFGNIGVAHCFLIYFTFVLGQLSSSIVIVCFCDNGVKLW